MPTKVRWLIMAAAVLVLAAASYVAISLLATGGLGLDRLPGLGQNGQVPNDIRPNEIILPTEVPQRPPDLVGPVVDMNGKSYVVAPDVGGSSGQAGPTYEVVVTAETKVYQDTTKGAQGQIEIVDGKLRQRVEPYAYNRIKLHDVLVAWGNLRGSRLVAETVIVEVMP